MRSVTVVSIVRLEGLVTFANSINPTWDNWSTGIWSTIEINVGIICACMPSLRLLLIRAFPKLLVANTPPSNQSSIKKGRRYAMATITSNSGKLGILYCQSYSIERSDGWNDYNEQLVQFEEVDAEFMKLRARDNEIWRGEGLYNSADAKSVASRLSTNFTPVP